MSCIVTITPNPCIDINADVPALFPDKKLHCSHAKKEPGGGGINVSRVIARLGGDTKAIYTSGGYTGKFLEEMLAGENINSCVVKTTSHTRENFIMKEISTGQQYKFGMPSLGVDEFEWHCLLGKLEDLPSQEYIVASGSLPLGMPTDFFARIAFIAKQKNSRLVVDTSGEGLKAALKEGVYMIKPNLGELAYLAGEKKLNANSAIKAAKQIIAAGGCSIVVVSMGAGGALLVSDLVSEYIAAPEVKVKSTVGAGDSMVAGMLLGLDKGFSLQQACRYGVACGTATTMNEGTALCKEQDVINLYTQMLIENVNRDT